MRNWILLGVLAFGAQGQPSIPRVWHERGFEGGKPAIAGQSFTAGRFTEEEYYKAPLDNLLSYPVYYPGREPEGYWDFLNRSPIFATRTRLELK
jgi:hypothetical protein